MAPELLRALFPAALEEQYELPEYMCSELEQGQSVIVQGDNRLTAGGHVDVVAADGSVFWVWLNHGLGRAD